MAKANRNYALEYIRNGIAALSQVVGAERAQALAQRSARLTGLQHYPVMGGQVGAVDGSVQDAADFLQSMMIGMGDECSVAAQTDGSVIVLQRGMRVARGLDGSTRENLLASWIELWRGAIHSHRTFMDLSCAVDGEAPDTIRWTIHSHPPAT